MLENKFIKKDKLKIYKFKHKEQKLNILKFLNYNNRFFFYKENNLRKKIALKIFNLKSSSLTLIKKRCVITGRSRSVLKKFKISRLAFKNLAHKGLLYNIKKSNN